MSIRGIDTQIMITRTSDVAKDASALMRSPQAAQEFLAEQGKSQAVQDQSRVQETMESEMDNIRTEEDGSGSGTAGGGGSGGEEEELTEEQEKELLVAPADHEQIIDIMV